jgi:hypothetical protein
MAADSTASAAYVRILLSGALDANLKLDDIITAGVLDGTFGPR